MATMIFTHKTKLKLDKEVGGGVLHEWWNSGSVLLFVCLCVLSDLSHIPLCLDRKFDYWSDTLILWDLIAAKKRFASDARFKTQVLHSKTPRAVLELFLRNACDSTYPICLDCKFRDASRGAEINCGPNAGDISAGNSSGISADDSKGISTGNLVGISMICRHSKTVQLS